MARTKKLRAKKPAPSTLRLRPGEVAILRTCGPNGEAHGEFQWPLRVGAKVEAPDWRATKACGNGLHGLLRGVGDGNLLRWDEDAKWLVVAALESECVDLEGKVKFPRCRVLHVGDRFTASALLRAQYPTEAVAAGTATAGDGGTATAGDAGTATAGARGTATAGDGGTATAGTGGVVIVRWWKDDVGECIAMGYVGEDGIEPNVPYRVLDGKLVRAETKKEGATAKGGAS